MRLKRIISWILISNLILPVTTYSQSTGLVGNENDKEIVLERDPNKLNQEEGSGDTGAVHIKPQSKIAEKYDFEGFAASNVDSCSFSSLGDWWLRLETPEYREAYLALRAFETLHHEAPFSNHLILPSGQKFSDATREIAKLLKTQRDAETKKFKEMNELFRCKCLAILGKTGIKDKDNKAGGTSNYDHFVNSCSSIDPTLTATVEKMKSQTAKGEAGSLEATMEDSTVGTLSYERKQVLLEWLKARMDYGFEMAGKYGEILEKITEIKAFMDSMEDPTNGWNYIANQTDGANPQNGKAFGKMIHITTFTGEKKDKWYWDWNYFYIGDKKGEKANKKEAEFLESNAYKFINPHDMPRHKYGGGDGSDVGSVQYKYAPFKGGWAIPYVDYYDRKGNKKNKTKRGWGIASAALVSGVAAGGVTVAIIGLASSAAALAIGGTAGILAFAGGGVLFGVAAVLIALEAHYQNQITYEYSNDYFTDEFLENWFGEKNFIIMDDITFGSEQHTTHNLLGKYVIKSFKKYAHMPFTDKVCGEHLSSSFGRGFFGSNGMCVKQVYRYNGSDYAEIQNAGDPGQYLKLIDNMNTQRLTRTYLVDPVIPKDAENEWPSMDIAKNINDSIPGLINAMKTFATDPTFVKDHSILKGRNKSTNDDKTKEKYQRITMASKHVAQDDYEGEMEDRSSTDDKGNISRWKEKVNKAFKGPTNAWNDISDFNLRTVNIPMKDYQPINMNDKKFQYNEKMGEKVKVVLKEKIVKNALFENPKDNDAFVAYTYDKHFIYPSISKPTYFRYPTQNGKAYWDYMVDMTTKYMMKIKELMGSSGNAVDLYAADLVKTQQYQKMGGGVPALQSKNVKITVRAAKAFNGIKLENGKLNFGEFQKDLNAIKNESAGDGKLDAGKMDAMLKASNAFRKVNEAKDKSASLKDKRKAAGLPETMAQEKIAAMGLPFAKGVANNQEASSTPADSGPSATAIGAYLNQQNEKKENAASESGANNYDGGTTEETTAPTSSLGNLWGSDESTQASAESTSPIEGMTNSDVEHMLTSAEKEKNDLQPSDEDSLFTIVSKCYKRNLSSVLVHKNQQTEKPVKKEVEKLDSKKEELKNLLDKN
jgi:hypothetical protein